ncbi:hypothetical protein K461DRAFT_277283 [Myriangium duriaei CBS 260.36]|uniref:Uncharacterized protein n=1 Tax=Myriangium duriaei CBS 260.36 TaxID=1168546 RepID=A0A9P4MNY5_9PEZI|nr:hypothetical protein K461DRAFT_277283 [Myriangium duriaei CBS 260.36]
MQITLAVLSALAATAFAGTANVVNRCNQPAYLTITRSDQTTQTYTLAAGQGQYHEVIKGQGNSYGVTLDPNYYSPNTPKLIWGVSDVPPTLYYSVNTVDGNPFANLGFSLVTSDSTCSGVNSPDARTRTCGDGAQLTLNLC